MSCCCLGSFVFCMWYILHGSKLYFYMKYTVLKIPRNDLSFLLLVLCGNKLQVESGITSSHWSFTTPDLHESNLLQYWSLLNWQNLRLRCGCCKFDFLTLFHHLLLNLRTLYIVWSLVRRRVALQGRVARRLTRLQTMCNVLKYCKIL